MMFRAFHRTLYSVKHDGIRKTVAKFLPLVIDITFDLRHGIETCGYCALDDLQINSENKKHGYNYKATRIVPLREILKLVRKCTPDDSVFVDFGCGKGRALFVAAESGFGTVRGVEFAPDLCAIARQNSERYKKSTRSTTRFEIVDSDASTYEVKEEEDTFFIANPFGAEIVGKVINNIAVSVQKKPRKIWIIYYNPHHQDILKSQKFLTGFEQHVLCDDIFVIYHN